MCEEPTNGASHDERPGSTVVLVPVRVLHNTPVPVRKDLPGPPDDQVRGAVVTAAETSRPMVVAFAALAFVEAWQRSGWLNEEASSITCDEADALAALIAAVQGDEAAAVFLADHSDGDGPGDRHFDEGATL